MKTFNHPLNTPFFLWDLLSKIDQALVQNSILYDGKALNYNGPQDKISFYLEGLLYHQARFNLRRGQGKIYIQKLADPHKQILSITNTQYNLKEKKMEFFFEKEIVARLNDQVISTQKLAQYCQEAGIQIKLRLSANTVQWEWIFESYPPIPA